MIQLDDISAQVFRISLELPLSSIEDVAANSGLKDPAVREAIRDLEEREILRGDKVGWACMPVMRRHVAKDALSEFQIQGPTWHDEGNRSFLFSRLPMIQTFYQLIAHVRNLGRFERFHWIAGYGLDAAVQFEEGWVAILWSGLRERESVLQSRVESLWRDYRVLASTDEAPWPGMVCFVVPDYWQAELVCRVLRRLQWDERQAVIWCLQTGRCPEIHIHRESRGGIYQPVLNRDTGGWSWERRLRDSPWASGNITLAKAMDLLEEWYPIYPDWMKGALNHSEKSRTAQRAFSEMVSLGLARKEQHGRTSFHFPTGSIRHTLAQVDGVSMSDVDHADPRTVRHEEVVRIMARQCLSACIPVACGYRSTEDMGTEGGGIAPDLMIFLCRSPFGPTWFYVEIEFSARGDKRIGRKFGKFASPLRQDDYPVLSVAATPRAESNFQSVARELGIRMLTTTDTRLKTLGILHDSCWSLNGENVAVGGPEKREDNKPLPNQGPRFSWVN